MSEKNKKLFKWSIVLVVFFILLYLTFGEKLAEIMRGKVDLIANKAPFRYETSRSGTLDA